MVHPPLGHRIGARAADVLEGKIWATEGRAGLGSCIQSRPGPTTKGGLMREVPPSK